MQINHFSDEWVEDIDDNPDFSLSEDGDYPNGREESISDELMDEIEAQNAEAERLLDEYYRQIFKEAPEYILSTLRLPDRDEYKPDAKFELEFPFHLKMQIEEYYDAIYSCQDGIATCSLTGVKETYRDLIHCSEDVQYGLLFLPQSKLFGIIYIPIQKIQIGFIDVWNKGKNAKYPRMYLSESKNIILLKELSLNEEMVITDENWECFFDNFPATVLRSYNEYVNRKA